MTDNNIDVNIVPVKNGAKRVVVSYYHYSRKDKNHMSSQMYEASYRVSPIPSTGCSKVRSPDSFTKNVFDFTHLTFSRWNLISKTSFAQPSCPKRGTM